MSFRGIPGAAQKWPQPTGPRWQPRRRAVVGRKPNKTWEVAGGGTGDRRRTPADKHLNVETTKPRVNVIADSNRRIFIT